MERGECGLFVWGRIHGEVPTHSTWALTMLMDESGGVETEGSGKYPEMSNLAVVGTSKGPSSQVTALWENQSLAHRTKLFPA